MSAAGLIISMKLAMEAVRLLIKTYFPRFLAAFALALLATSTTASSENVTAAGRIAGSFAIGTTGGATYGISIATPPGIQGMQPGLSLTYASQGQNGQLGMGFSLSGLPFIERCGQTIAQDGKTSGVAYDADDRFCLNGQRLVNLSTEASAPYYADGAAYHTEIESWTNVIATGGACGSGPCAFRATTRSGVVLEFATTDDSRILAQGAPGSTTFTSGAKAGSVRIWALASRTDPHGNRLTVDYTQSPADASGSPLTGAAETGAYYVSRIDYTANEAAAVAPMRSVQFTYEERTDRPLEYQGGAVFQNAARMAAIETCIADPTKEGNGVSGKSCADLTRVSTFTLDYCDEQETCTLASTTGRSLVTAVTRCDGDGICLPSTRFEWQRGTNGTVYINGTSTGELQTSSAYCAIDGGLQSWADFDGNGLADFICAYPAQGSRLGSVNVLLNDGKQLNPPAGAPASGLVSQSAVCQDGVIDWTDLNGDGLADWLCNDPLFGQVRALLSNGATIVSPNGDPRGLIAGTSAICPKPGSVIWADFNGDSRTDWICSDPASGQFWVMLSDGQNLASVNDPLSHSSSTARLVYNNRAICGNAANVGWADFNGDGMIDWICDDPALPQTSVFLSTGKSLEPAGGGSSGTLASTRATCPGTADGKAERLWLDFNADGLADWVCNDFAATGNIKVLLSTSLDLTSASGAVDGTLPIGESRTALCVSPSGSGSRQVAWADFNGDGLVDWICSDLTAGNAQVLLSSGSALSPVAGTVTMPRCELTSTDIKIAEWFDFNGDGLTDAVCNQRQTPSGGSVGKVWVALHDGLMPDLGTAITDGLGGRTEVTYRPLTDPQVYKRAPSDYPLGEMLGFPDILVDIPSYVAASYTLTNDPAVNAKPYAYSYRYHYEGGMIGLDGRGWLGFARTSMIDPQVVTDDSPQGTKLTSRFSQTFPFTGALREKLYCANTSDATPCSQEAAQFFEYRNSYVCEGAEGSVCLPGQPFQPYAGVYQPLIREESESDTSFGSELRKTYAYNLYGQATRVTDLGDVGNGASHPVTTCSNYLNNTDPARWAIGLLADKKLGSVAECPADATAWQNYVFNEETDLTWTHWTYDAKNDVTASLGWDDGNDSWLGRGFTYGDGLGNRTAIFKLAGENAASVATVPNSTYTIEYDTSYRSFPAILTTPPADAAELQSALTARLAFDARFGTRVGMVDLNGHVTTTCLDGFGRSRSTQGPQQTDGGATDPNCLAGAGYSYLPAAFTEAKTVTLADSMLTAPTPGIITLTQRQRQSWADPWSEAAKTWSARYGDGLGRVYRQVAPGDGANVVTLSEYTGQKRLSRTSFPFFEGTPEAEISWAVSTYDVYGRPKASTQPYDGGLRDIPPAATPCTADDPEVTVTTCYSYSPPNRVLVTRAANSAAADQKLVRFEYYNGLRRPVQMTTDGTVNYSFDLLGNPVGVVDGSGVRSEIAYDSLGRRTFLEEIDLGPRHFEYDEIGRLALQRDGRDTRIEFAYDGLNRILSKSYIAKDESVAAQRIAFTYDTAAAPGLANVKGRRATAALLDLVRPENSSTYSYGYDAYGRAEASILTFEGSDHRTVLAYNPDGSPAGATLPDRRQSELSFSFATSGLLESIALADGGDAQDAIAFDDYSPLGRPGRQTYRNGVTERFGYADSGAIRAHTITAAGGSGDLLSEAYRWDQLGHISEIIDCGFPGKGEPECAGISGTGESDYSQRFTYRSNRLETANGVYGEKNFGYDGGGNMLQKDGIDYIYASQRPEREGEPSHQVATGSDGLAARYDGNGNMLEKTLAGNDWALSYDLLNKMVSASRNGKKTNDYVYDFAGRRLKKVTYGNDGGTIDNTVRYISPLVETTAFGTGDHLQYTRYVPGLSGKAIATTSADDPLPAERIPAGTPLPDTSITLHRNAVASTYIVTDAAGAFHSRVNYTPYGAIHTILPEGSDHYRQKFDGHEFDQGIGIYDFAARFFDQDIGRFRSADTQLAAGPLAQDAFNRYELNLSDPIALTDPTGNTPCGTGAAIALSAGGAAVGGLGLGALGAAGGAIGGAVGGAIADGGKGAAVGAVSVGTAGGLAGLLGGIPSGAGIGLAFCAYLSSGQAAADQLAAQTRTNQLLQNIGLNDELRNDALTQIQTAVEVCADRNSFPAEVIVQTNGAKTKAVDALKPGDTVLGFDGSVGRAFSVSSTRSYHAEIIHVLALENERIKVTASHPFMVIGRGWVPAAALRVGDKIQDMRGEGHALHSNDKESEPQFVYDLKVQGADSYYIGKAGLLVHNSGCTQPDELGEESDLFEIAENGKSSSTTTEGESAGLGEADLTEVAEDGADIASVAGEGGADVAAIGDATAVAAEGATDVAEGAAVVAGGAEVSSDIVEGLAILCAALCWL